MNTTRIPNSVFLPPSLSEYAIKGEENQSSFNLYTNPHSSIRPKTTKKTSTHTSMMTKPTSQRKILLRTVQMEKTKMKKTMMRMKVKIHKNSYLYKQEHFICTLYKWVHQDKLTPSCSKQSKDTNSTKLGENKQYTVVLKLSASPKASFAVGHKNKQDLEAETERKIPN